MPKLDGLEVLYPSEDDEGKIKLEVAAEDSDIVILRRVKGGCSYGMSWVTHPREVSDEEIVELAKEVE